jgi:16S rRNA G966 N2-methylase RsmD
MEENARHCEVIDANIRSLGYDGQTRVIRGKVASLPTVLAGSRRKDGPCGKRYDLVFIDPPYDDDPWARIFSSLIEGRFLGGNAWVVAEHKSKRNLESGYGSLMLTSRKAYGDSAISMFTVASDNG